LPVDLLKHLLSPNLVRMKTSYILDSLFSLSALRAARRKRCCDVLDYRSALPDPNSAGNTLENDDAKSVKCKPSYTAWSGARSTPPQILRDVQSADGEDQNASLGARPSGRNANVQR
jgi:hypothetical protein